MNDKIKSKRAVRRRRTTRRLTRKPIRVPEDKVPRASNDGVSDASSPFEGSSTSVGHFEAPSAYRVLERGPTISLPPDDLYDIDLDVDDPEDSLKTVSRPPPDPAVLERYARDADDHYARGYDEDEEREPDTIPDLSSAMPSRDQFEPQAETAPTPDAPVPDAPRTDAVDDEPTRPRIEITEEMALAAGRLTSPDPIAALTGDDDTDTDPKIQTRTEPATIPEPSVIVSPARVISDRPGPPDGRESDPDGFGYTELDDGSLEALRAPEDEHEGVDVDDSMVLEESDASDPREPRTPPPPPPKNKKRPPPPPARPKSAERSTWWQTFFDEDYLRTYCPPTRTQVARQCDFICESLELSTGQSVLDLGCGVGLQAVELARRGFSVVALDVSAPMIQSATEEASTTGVDVSFEQADMREIDYEGRFDAIVSLGTSFGFFEDDLQVDLLKRIHRGLKPGGRFFLDVVNRDYVQATQPNLVWYQGEDCICMEESDFNYFTSRLAVKRTVMREGGRQHESEFSLRLYSLHELGQLIQSAGLRVTEVSAQEATRGMFFGSNSARMMLLAEKLLPVPDKG